MACITGTLAVVGDALGSIFGGSAAAAGAGAVGAEAAGVTAADLGLGALGVAAPSTISGLTAAAIPGAVSGIAGAGLAGAAAGALPGIIDGTAAAIPEQVLVTAPSIAGGASGAGLDALAPLAAGAAGAGTVGALNSLAGQAGTSISPGDPGPSTYIPPDGPEQVTVTGDMPSAPSVSGVPTSQFDPFLGMGPGAALAGLAGGALTAPPVQSTWGTSLGSDLGYIGESLGLNSAMRYLFGSTPAAGVPGGGGAGGGTGGAGIGGAGGSGSSGVPGGQEDFSGSSGALTQNSARTAKGLSGTALTLGALAALGSAFSPKQKSTGIPGPASTAATRGPLFGAPLNTTGAFNRTAVPNYTPATGSFYTYGQMAEPQFFNDNQITLPGMAKGGAIGAFDTRNGQRLVRGPGTGTSDSVPARLSDGEYVLTAADVARIGGGSNEAGARKLDRERTHLARSAGNGRIMRRPKGSGFLSKAAR